MDFRREPEAELVPCRGWTSALTSQDPVLGITSASHAVLKTLSDATAYIHTKNAASIPQTKA